ncbi:MAG: phosphatidylserine decarboxylase [Cryobacterium sp.]|nr:phosphatidylserine decarboxylase [Oligoflexia bacterium]
MSKDLLVFDRHKNQIITENIFGEGGVRFLYENPFGAALESTVLCRPWFSKLYGAYQNTERSAKSIPDFIKRFEIPMSDYESGPFHSFNEFFIRKLKPGARPFEPSAHRLAAPSEGRYLFLPSVQENTKLPIKGATLNGPALLGDFPEMKPFIGGPGFISRLCPVDYHRFHFPDAGKILSSRKLSGPLHSVNPIALAARGDLLFRNEREVTILQTENFGKIAYVEVGAICVGKIVQTHSGQTFQRGDEKGYFLFGGSTVIVIGEPRKFAFDADLLEKSASGRETLIRIGEGIATAV